MLNIYIESYGHPVDPYIGSYINTVQCNNRFCQRDDCLYHIGRQSCHFSTFSNSYQRVFSYYRSSLEYNSCFHCHDIQLCTRKRQCIVISLYQYQGQQRQLFIITGQYNVSHCFPCPSNQLRNTSVIK